MDQLIRSLIVGARLTHQHRCGENHPEGKGCGKLLEAYGRRPAGHVPGNENTPMWNEVWTCRGCSVQVEAPLFVTFADLCEETPPGIAHA